MDVPPPIPPRPPGYELRTPANPNLGPTPIPQASLPESYHRNVYSGPPPTQAPRPQAPPGQPTQWSALNYSDGVHTPLFEQFIAAVFEHLDPQRTGYIRPEVLSNFLDLNGFKLEDNLWKANLTGNIMFAPEDIADAELKAACEAWPFEHQVTVRFPGRRQLPFGGMPLLSLRGLIDMMAVENAAEPERAHRGINATLSCFRIWPHLGPLPRNCLLKDMPIQVQRRIDDVRVRSVRAAQEKLQANQTRLALEAQGRQNALDLLDPPYVRRYYY